jgi:hypothetical protein
METFFKNVVGWGGLAILFFWLQTSRVLDFGINPNFLILGLVLAWNTGRLWPPIIFSVLAASIYFCFLPFSPFPIIAFLVVSLLIGLISKFLTGKPLLDEVLGLVLGLVLFNLLVYWNFPDWSWFRILEEILITEAILFLSWPVSKIIR